jgi:hypothetical protein
MNGVVKSVVAAPFEKRRILVAQGIEFNNKDVDDEDVIPDGSLKTRMDDAGLPLVITSPGKSATFRSAKQGVDFMIKVINTKSELKAALEDAEKLHVIYDGHSRFGRGCCFGTNTAPGEDWENGSNPKINGLFRSGFPYVAVPVSDIKHHGYTADLVPVSETLKLSQCEPDLRNAVTLKSVRPHTLKDVDAAVHGQLRINKKAIDPADRFWAFRWPGEGFSVVLHAGWEKTASAPLDLGETNITCRVFCHFGCSSLQHYHEILRNRKSWKKVGDTDKFAYFTGGLSYAFTASHWLFHLLNYDVYNAFQPWEPSLEYARKKANLDIKKSCLKIKVPIYQIV